MREIDIGIEPNAKFETQVAAARAQLFDGDRDLFLCRGIKNPNASIHLSN